jgi:hypothetical protein
VVSGIFGDPVFAGQWFYFQMRYLAHVFASVAFVAFSPGAELIHLSSN